MIRSAALIGSSVSDLPAPSQLRSLVVVASDCPLSQIPWLMPATVFSIVILW
jgi:hypothetical protein